MEIAISKGSLLGVFLALVFVGVSGYVVRGAMVAFLWDKTGKVVALLTWVIALGVIFLAGWGGWELGHWFTS